MSGYTREQLIELCERGIVPESKWLDRDSHGAQSGLGKAWALLRAGCDFRDVSSDSDLSDFGGTVWIRIYSKGFKHFDWDGGLEDDLFYIPTAERLDRGNGGDWY
jgi:hypothetical protein